jgi:riboflavin kinase/FMN adenylyltransferase
MMKYQNMVFFDSLEQVPADFGPSVVTVGKFDGVHLGHRSVLDALVAAGTARGLVSTALTFDRHPLSLFAPEKCPDALVSNRQKVELLADAGVDATLMVTFDREFAALSAEEFVRGVLVDTLHAQLVLAGADFRFGAKAAGDFEMLQRLGSELGFEVQLIEDVQGDGAGRRTSSTWVRELLEAGKVQEAAALLGRAPAIRSTVVQGEARGRVLGFPTANLDPDVEGFRPADGVYAAWAIVDGERYPAAVSIGNNPTFEGVPEHRIEAYLIDAALDLYGRELTIEFVDFVRPMNRFDSVEALIAQLSADVEQIRATLGDVAPGIPV